MPCKKIMGKLVKFTSGDSTVLIESTEVETDGWVQVGAVETAEKDIDKLLGLIKPLSTSLVSTIKSIETKPDSISAEFGLGVSAEGNVFVMKASGEASLKVTLTWNKV